MANKGTICTVNNVEYSDIRIAMINGARTLEEVQEETGLCGNCEGCTENIDYILSTLCGCKDVSMQTVIDLVEQGIDTVDEISEKTQAGTGEDCGKCKKLIENIIHQGY